MLDTDTWLWYETFVLIIFCWVNFVPSLLLRNRFKQINDNVVILHLLFLAIVLLFSGRMAIIFLQQLDNSPMASY